MPIFDLPDDRRAGKAGLPSDDRDVTNGLVVEDKVWGKPWCVQHGAMNRVDPVEQIWRCQMCGVGARWEKPEEPKGASGSVCDLCGSVLINGEDGWPAKNAEGCIDSYHDGGYGSGMTPGWCGVRGMRWLRR